MCGLSSSTATAYNFLTQQTALTNKPLPDIHPAKGYFTALAAHPLPYPAIPAFYILYAPSRAHARAAHPFERRRI